MLEHTAALQKALNDADKDVRSAARIALSRLDRVAKARGSIDILSGDDKPAKLQLLAALADGRGAQAAEALSRVLAEDEDEDCRAAAARGLRCLGLAEVPSALAAAAADGSPAVRAEVARALGTVGQGDVAGPLVAMLADEPSVAVEAAESLARLGVADAVPDIAKCLTSAAPEVRATAARALGRLRDGRAVSELAAVLDDADRDVRLAAAQALAQMPLPES